MSMANTSDTADNIYNVLYCSHATALMNAVELEKIRDILVDCLSRAKDTRRAKLIEMMMQLLATDQLSGMGL